MLNNKHKQLIESIKTHFDFLFQNGYSIIKEETGSMGSWIVFLRSKDCTIRIFADRGEVFVSIGPKWGDLDWGNHSEYADLDLIMGYITKKQIERYSGDLSDKDKQLDRLAKILDSNYPRITPLFSEESFQKTEKELHSLWLEYSEFIIKQIKNS